MNIARSSLKIFSANIGSSVLTFGAITVFARQIPQADLGAFFLFQALLGLLSIASDLGIRDAIEKRISEGQDGGDVYATGLLLKSGLLVLVLITLQLLNDVVNQYLGGDFSGLLIAAIIAQEAFFTGLKVLNSELRVGETGVLRFSQVALWVIVSELLILWGMGTSALLYGLVCSLAVVACWAWIKQSTSLGRPSAALVGSIYRYSKYASVMSAGSYLYSWVDVLLIGYILTQSQVAIYEVAWRVSLLVLLLSNAIGMTIFPQISEWDANRKTNQIENLVNNAVLPSVILSIPAAFGVAALAPNILALLFGPAYATGGLVLTILMVNTVVQSIHAVIGRVLPAMNRPDLAAKATLFSIAANILLNYILILQFGIVGASVATVLAAMLGGYLAIKYASQLVTIQIPYRELLWCTVASTVMLAVLIGVKQWLPITTIPKLLIVITFGSAIYWVALLSVPRMRAHIHSFIRAI